MVDMLDMLQQSLKTEQSVHQQQFPYIRAAQE
jgi:hypothetical protein